MDLSGLEALIPPLAQYLNIEPATLLLLIGVLVTLSNILSRVIPDDVRGFWGVVRNIATVIGIYVANRVTHGVTENDVTRKVIGMPVPPVADNKIEDLAKSEDALIPKVAEEVVPAPAPIVPPFPNHPHGGD